MDAGRFDTLSKALAARRSRRSLGVGGLAAGLLAALGTEPADAKAKSCSLTILATTATGKHHKKTYAGTLSLHIGVGGAIDDGSFDLDDGTSLPLVGQATGRALHLRVTLADKTVLILEGTAANDLVLCRGEISGIFGGPDATDLGTWRTVSGTAATGESTTTTTTTPAPSSAGGSSGGDGAGGNSAGNASAGGGVSCGGVSCSDGQVCHQDACCTPQTCPASVCAETYPDGCGGEAKCAGSSICATGEVCYLNQCCPPRACQSYECGLHDDGCGGMVDCKDPCAGAGCDSTGTCCAIDCPAGGCGTMTNNCGASVVCPCPAGSSCVDGRCCAALNADCANVPCCVGYCGQDNTCSCNGSGEQCAHVGTGGCCNGDCLADDTCP